MKIMKKIQKIKKKILNMAEFGKIKKMKNRIEKIIMKNNLLNRKKIKKKKKNKNPKKRKNHLT